MKGFDVTALTRCLAKNILYIAVFLFVLFGLIFSAAMSMAQELRKPSGRVKLPLFLSLTIHASSYVLMCSLAAFFVDILKINPLLMCFIAGFMGIGSLFLSQWLFNLWSEAEGLQEFIDKVSLIGRTLITTFNTLKNRKDDDTSAD
ncbi:hypothetical protein [Spirosoma luteum]|uniref:hypothetical protein n=1 Tax=Spirosoma luteum TaxID=431553 RepID=UPI000371342E|nr:hypothetical protein [Spirosoma luteum]